MADGVWRACAVLDVRADGAHDLLFMRGAALSHLTASGAAAKCNLSLLDGEIVNRKAAGQPVEKDATFCEEPSRTEATRFRPKLSLPEQD